MNKIILFLIIIIIGSALSTNMGNARPKRISNTEFDCTLKAIKVCGSDDSASTNKCLRKYMERCEKNPPTRTHNTQTSHVKNHKNHHTYKTTIVVKNKYDRESKRICITDSKCNCGTIAKTKCAKTTGDYGVCLKTTKQECRERCNQSRRCYRMDCSNAGKSRCNENASIKCSLKFPNSDSDRQTCVQKRVADCLKHEKSTCRRALRVYRFRRQCKTQAKRNCRDILDEDKKCNCVGKSLHSCLVKKVETYRRKVRRVLGCEEGAKVICSEKKCGSPQKQCIVQEQDLCEPVCQRESRLSCNNQLNGPCYEQAYKRCIKKWKRNFCDNTAQIKCGHNEDCLELKLKHCKRSIPGCMKGESCNDNNKCTTDICDPVQGCINKPKDCDDNNACTTEHCDPVLGCVYKKKNCDDGVLCTRDSCDSVTGQCIHKFDKSICYSCAAGPCQVDTDCNAWSKSKGLSSKCKEAYCNVKTGSCMSRKIKQCAEQCKVNCLPYHACDSAQCVLNKNSQQFECVHSRKSCDDHKSCTIDTCDKTLGCVHTLDRETCPNHPVCDSDSDCKNWATTHNFERKCKKAVCDIKRGICVARATSTECDLSECQKNCKPKDSCETTKCVVSEGGAICSRTPIICDDKKACTVDKCDPKLGCVFKYTVNEVCKQHCQCSHNVDCKDYESRNKLADQCLKAVCDQSLGACVKVSADKECKIKRKDCKTDCVSTSACDIAKCVKVANSEELVCKHTQRNCDDGVLCTKDSCDPALGCVHTFTRDDEICPFQCASDSDCLKWGFSLKLGKQCKKAACNKKAGSCYIVPKERTCVTLDECSANCVAKNLCESASCALNEKGDYFCKRVTKNTCNDGNECTLDICEPLTGQCSHTPISSPKCQTTPTCPNCAPINSCETAKCIDSGEGFICLRKPVECDDSNACTVDSCDNLKGCVHTYVTSEKCPPPKDQCKECTPKNACESAVCVKNPDQSSTCKRTLNTCNDGKECTKDSCDTTTGKCSNVYTVCAKCPPDAQCNKNLDCKAWAVKKGYDLDCLTPVCDDKLGACKVVPNGNKCKPKFCKKACPPRNACEDSTCSYDVLSKKLLCDYQRKTCDDKNKCTKDSCDPSIGCVFTFDKTITGCDTPICKQKSDCASWASQNNLADKCQNAICDDETKTCRSVLINNKDCNPCLNECKKTCVAASACESAQCIADPETKKCSCSRKAITCDDKNPCTTDVCDKVKGCVFTYTKSDKCTEYCKTDSDCVEYGNKHKCSLNCKKAVCDKTTTSCKIIDNPDPSCKPIKRECDLICKPRNACETAKCVRKTNAPNEFQCVYESVVCSAKKQPCYTATCDKVKGCVYSFKANKDVCLKECEKDLDCATIETTENLAKRCLKAVCDKTTFSCKRVKGADRPDCGDQCNLSSDCPQSKFGTVCCINSGLKKCCDNECETDLDCPCSTGQWGYCKKRENGKKECMCKDKCKGNEDCDDKNPCTRDVCLKEYGFCKNLPRCVDNSACTLDVCVPSPDLKSYTCKNPARCCTNQKDLLDKEFDKLSSSEKTKWLGLCSHTEGCKTCVVSAQCDDNNGCTKDDCINQFCVSTPIDNKWCDPKIKGQAIKVQAYFPDRARL